MKNLQKAGFNPEKLCKSCLWHACTVHVFYSRFCLDTRETLELIDPWQRRKFLGSFQQGFSELISWTKKFTFKQDNHRLLNIFDSVGARAKILFDNQGFKKYTSLETVSRKSEFKLKFFSLFLRKVLVQHTYVTLTFQHTWLNFIN